MEDGKEVLTLSEDQTLSWESTGNLVTLTFSSDSSIVGRGFLASVQSGFVQHKTVVGVNTEHYHH